MADELTIREILDQLRNYHAKQVKPFEKLPQVIEAAVQIIEHDLPAAKRELENLSGFIAKLRDETPDVEAEARAAQVRVTVSQKEAAAAEDAARTRIAEADTRAQDRETMFTREDQARRLELETDYNERVSTMADDIKRLTAQRDALTEEVAALRQKFSRF